MIEGRVNIEGYHQSVVPIVTSSFVFKASDKNYHAALINLDDEGNFVIKVDGDADSEYIREAQKSSMFKKKIDEASRKLYDAYASVDDAFFSFYSHLDQVLAIDEIKTQLDNLTCEKYHRLPFQMPSPSKQQIIDDLTNEFNASHIQTEDLNSFINRKIDTILVEREAKHSLLEKYYNNIQDLLEASFNKEHKEKFALRKEQLIKNLSGKEKDIEKDFSLFSTNFKIPFMTDMDYTYDSNKGVVCIELIIPQYLNCPNRSVTLTRHGLEVTKKFKEDRLKDILKCIKSTLIYTACRVFNLASCIKSIEIILWYRTKAAALGWFNFKRSMFVDIKPQNIDPDVICEESLHIFKTSQGGIVSIERNHLIQLIRNKHYEAQTNNTLNKRLVAIYDVKLYVSRKQNTLDVSDLCKEIHNAEKVGANVVFVYENMIPLIQKEINLYKEEERKRKEIELIQKQIEEKRKKQEEQRRKELERIKAEREWEEEYRRRETEEKLNDFYSSWGSSTLRMN